MTIENPKPEGQTFDTLEEALIAIHGVPRVAAEAVVKYIGSSVNYEVSPDGKTKIQLPKEGLLSRIKKLLSPQTK